VRVVELMSALRMANVDVWVDGDRLRYSAPRGALAPDLRAALVEHKAQVIDFLGRASSSSAPVPAIVPVDHNQPLPLSFPQRRIWFFEQIWPGTSTYHMAASWRVRGALDVPALQECFSAVARRHAALRTRFELSGEEPVQVVVADVTVPMPVIDLTALSETGRDAELKRLMPAELGRPFDLTLVPLMRTTVLRTGKDEHILMLTIHHIVADMWSVDVLLRELAALYRPGQRTGSPQPALAQLPVQYADYAVWQRSSLAADVLSGHLDYWTQRLGNAPAFLELPTDRPRPPARTYAGARETIPVPPDLLAEIDALCRRYGATRFMVMLAAYAILLSRYSGDTDIVIGSPVANRTRSELEGLIGVFVNILVLRVDVGNDPTFADLLSQVREVALGAYEHQDLPVEQLVETLHPRRDPARPPLFQAMFVLQNAATSGLELCGLTIEELPSNRAATEYDLTLEFADSATDPYATVQYNTDIFGPDTAARLLGHWQALLHAIVAHPQWRLSSLPMLTDAERADIAQWNETGRQHPADYVHDLIARQAAQAPDTPALIYRDRGLSYAELDAAASVLAARLRAAGVSSDAPVAVYVQRSPEMVVSLLAVLKAGGAYLPIDTTLPPERVSYMLEDAGVAVVVTTRKLQQRLAADHLRLVCTDADPDAGASEQAEVRPGKSRLTADSIAYVIYTSGSTGRPKGVMVEHRNLTNFVAAMGDLLGDQSRGVWLAVTSVSFDIAALELLWPLTRGWAVVLQDDADVVPGIGSRLRTRRLDFSLFYFAMSHQERMRDRYRLLLDGARFADHHGFSAVWTPERHFNAFGGLYPNPSVTSAALAAITDRVKIRAGSVVLPLHDPVRVAEDWAVIDNLSGGRVGISFASGWHADDFILASDPAVYSQRKPVMLEAIETVRGLWRGQPISRRNGAGRDVEMTIFPRPLQPELPIWLAAAGSPETFRVAGEIGAGVLSHLLGQGLDELADKIAVYRRAWRTAGHEGDGNVVLMAHAFTGPDSTGIRALVREPFREYLRGSFGLVRALAPSLGTDDASTGADVETLLDFAFEQYYSGSALMGTVGECVAMAGQLRDLGVDDIACLIDFGVPADAVLGALPLLDQVRQQFEVTQQIRADYSLAAQIERHRVTHVQCTPSLASILLADPQAGQALRKVQTLVVGGEALTASLARELVGTSRVFNMYGPTETTIWSTAWPVAGLEQGVSIGKAIANTEAYILDKNMDLVPVGVPGELCIGGLGVARGYLNRPGLTAERFVPSPFAAGARLYRTGDRARYRPDGTIEFLGRMDRQVKLAGHRVELGEIESVLLEHGAVRQAAVVARDDSVGHKHLVAYLAGESRPSPAELRGQLLRRLPEIMVPAVQIWLDELPLTSSGKIDYRALPDPGRLEEQRAVRSEFTGHQFVAPRDDVERAIAAVWQDVLKVDGIGVHDTFFELGGHSLMAIQMVSRLRGALSRDVTLRVVFESATVAQLAERLRGSESEPEAFVLPPLLPTARTSVIPLSFAQQRMWFFEQMNPGVPAYHLSAAFRLYGHLSHDALHRAFNEIVRRHEVLRTNFAAVDGLPAQVIAASRHIPLPCLDVSGLQGTEREAVVLRLISDESRAPVDLERGSLLRTALLRVGPDEHVLLLTTHHIVSDSWSIGVLARELSSLYDAYRHGLPPSLPALPAQYADFTLWQHGWLQGPLLDRQLGYWRGALADIPPLMVLPSDRPRPQLPTHQGAQVGFRLGIEVTDGLKSLSLSSEVTVFVTLLAAFSALLRRWAGTDHVVLGVPVAGRGIPELEPLIGVFANVTVLHADMRGDPLFMDVMRAVHDVVLGAYDHQDLPVEKLVADLSVERHPSYNPLFQVMFVYINDLVMAPSLGDLTMSPVDAHVGSVFMDLNMSMEDGPDGLQGALDYSAELFDRVTIDWLLASFQEVLAAVVADPEVRVSQLPLAAGQPSWPADTSAPQAEAIPPATPIPAHLVVSSTFTAIPLLESLNFWMERLDIPATVEFAPFNQVFQQLLDPASAMARNEDGVNVVLVRMEDWRGADVREEELSEEFAAAVSMFQRARNTELVVMLCPTVTSDLEADANWRSRLMARFAEADRVLCIDMVPMLGLYAVEAYADYISDEAGRIPYTAEFFAVIGTCLARQISALVSTYPGVLIIDACQRLEEPAREILTRAAATLAERGRRIVLSGSPHDPGDDESLLKRLDAAVRDSGAPSSDCAYLSGDEAACSAVRNSRPGILVLQHPAGAAELADYLAHTWLLDVPACAIAAVT
jgi:natural product biosynthesis luciferase-like monooxygenase protein